MILSRKYLEDYTGVDGRTSYNYSSNGREDYYELVLYYSPSVGCVDK